MKLFILLFVLCVSFAKEESLKSLKVIFEFTNRNLYPKTQIIDIQKLSNLTWIPRKDIKILVHGFRNSAKTWYVQDMVQEYLKKDNFNIITVDYSQFRQKIDKKFPYGAFIIGRRLGEFLVALRKAKISKKYLHLIGSSLGSHIAANGAKYFKSKTGLKVARLTGLDPSGEQFELAPKILKLQTSDADFVDIIHTDFGGAGLSYDVGHINFYPNNGVRSQPFCRNLISFLMEYYTVCSHRVVNNYFIESINSFDFVGYQCDLDVKNMSYATLKNFTSYQQGHCHKNPTAIMGDNCDRKSRGHYFLTINYKNYIHF